MRTMLCRFIVGKRALRLLAAYYDNYEPKESVFSKLQEWLSDAAFSQSRTLKTVAATIYLNEDNHKEAFKLLKDPQHLEQYVNRLFVNRSDVLPSQDLTLIVCRCCVVWLLLCFCVVTLCLWSCI